MNVRLISNLIFLILIALILYFFNPHSVIAANIVLNEIMAKSDPEWIEIYNSTNQNIDLNGWKIKDANSSDSDDLTINGNIGAKGFLTFEHSKGWLNDSGGETVVLLDNNSQSVDSYTYQTATEEKTFVRIPDGGDWQTDQDSTKNS